jgi:HK97 family phage prohead protease
MTKHVRTAQVRDVEGDGRNFSAVAVRYNTIDDYQTVFAPGCFADSLQRRRPTITWGHDWSEPIGRVVSFEDTPEALIIHARLSDPEAVPRARQAMAQLRDGDIDDVSVGFSIDDSSDTKEEKGVVTFLRATLNEVACVLRGAVPGAKVLAIRSAPGMVIEAETAGQLLAQLKAGSLTLKDALQAVEDSSIERPPIDPTDEPVEVETPEGDEEEAPAEKLAEEGPVGSPTEETQEDPAGEDESDEDDEDLKAKKAYDWEMELALKELDDQQAEKLVG